MYRRDGIYFEDIHFKELELDTFESKEFISCIFEGINLNQQSLASSKFIECKFINCNLSNSRIVETGFREVSFGNCKLVGLNWSSTSSVLDLCFEECQLDFSIFQDLKLPGLVVKNCSCKSVDFSRCEIKNSDFFGSNLLDTFFSHCNFEKSDFREVKNHSIDLKMNNLKGAKFDILGAMAFVEQLGIQIEK
jgi:uncharacterized protein YjbI with pentapeptide repeats